jgi:hypothetical protein
MGEESAELRGYGGSDDAGYGDDAALDATTGGIAPGIAGGAVGGGPAMATAYTSTYGDGFTDDTPDAGYSDDGGDVDDDLEATRAQIEQTRSEMSTTIDAIQEKLSPSNIAQQAKDTVKEATVGKAQEMVSDAGNTAKGFGSNFIETVKANPVPAAIAGLGLGWLFMSGRKNDSADSYSYSNRQNSAHPSGYNPGPRPVLRLQWDGLRLGQFGFVAVGRSSQPDPGRGEQRGRPGTRQSQRRRLQRRRHRESGRG